MFQVNSPFSPQGDQIQAIKRLSAGVTEGKKNQVLLGVTGSGKTFTMAKVIESVDRPSLILAHNKTLAAQLYQEFAQFFPHNAVEYFVSYYDYYQPEAYVARTDTYIEKDLSINDRIERLRLRTVHSLLERRDVIVVSSVSCIYGLGSPKDYQEMHLSLHKGQIIPLEEVLVHLIDIQYDRKEGDFYRGTFRVRGDILEIFPACEDDLAFRVHFFEEEVERIERIDPLTGKALSRCSTIRIYPGSHHVSPKKKRETALIKIRSELDEQLAVFAKENKLLEAERLSQRTKNDIALIAEMGRCKGIENYSRHFDDRAAGEPPSCLLDYFPEDYLLFIDESHQTLPQIKAMYHGDFSRKRSLVNFGFRMPSAYDNRPLTSEEFHKKIPQRIYVSATPGPWEIEQSGGEVVYQLTRPTGLLDPCIECRPAKNQIDDSVAEMKKETEGGGRVLVTTLTKRLAEELTDYLQDEGIRAKYMHSDIDTLERIQIIHDLRKGSFEVLVGINLLREGLDIPEVSLVMILDADKEGFLRSETALVQTCGRAARHEKGRVIMYADRTTKSMRRTLDLTQERREHQQAYNKKHGIIPRSTSRQVSSDFGKGVFSMEEDSMEDIRDLKLLRKAIKESEAKMWKAAQEWRYEEAARHKKTLRHYQKLEEQLL